MTTTSPQDAADIADLALEHTVLPLRGRAAERQQLAELVAAVRAGRSGAVVVVGEAGIGKSRLVAELQALAAAQGVGLIAAAADVLERDVPLAALRRALGGLDGAEAVVGAVLAAARTRPTVVAFDNVHWADAESVHGLRLLLRRRRVAPFGLVITTRPAPGLAEARDLVEELRDVGVWLELDGLSDPAVQEVLADRLGADPGQRLRTEAARAGGNPLFLEALAYALRREDALEVRGTCVELRAAVASVSVRDVVHRRLRGVSSAALEILRIGSLLGTTFAAVDVATVLGRPLPDLVGAFQQAQDARLLSQQGPLLRFGHDLVRDAVYDDIGTAVRSGLHRHAARSLRAAGAPLATVATQFALAAGPGDTEAAQALRQAAADVRDGQPRVAVTLLRQALDLSAGQAGLAEQVTEELAEAVGETGAAGEALDLLDRLAMRSVDPERTWRAQIAGVRLAERHERRDLLERVVGLRRSLPAEDPRQAELAGWQAIAVADWPWPQFQAVATEALSLADRHTSMLARALAHRALWVALHNEGRFRESLEHAQAAADVARSLEPDLRVISAGAVTSALHWVERDDEALALLEAMAPGGDLESWRHGYLVLVRARLKVKHGQWPEALADLQLALAGDSAVVEEAHVLPVALPLALARADAALLDLCEQGQRLTAGDIDVPPEVFGSYQWSWHERAALLASGRGDEEAALDHLLRLREGARRAARPAAYFGCGPLFVRLLLARGRVAEAGEVVAALDELAARSDLPGVQAVAHRCRGLLTDDLDEHERAVSAALQSRWVARRLGLFCDAAACAAGHGRAERARELYQEARTLATRLEDPTTVGQIDAALRELGVRRGVRGPRGRPSSGWASLTQTEARVVELACAGLTNTEIGQRLYVSRGTVATHLSHVFTKLGVRSRVELLLALPERAAPAPATGHASSDEAPGR